MPKRWGDGVLSLVRLWSFQEDVLLELDSERGTAVAVSDRGETGVAVDRAVGEALRRMVLGPVSPDNVLRPRHLGGEPEWALFASVLDRLCDVVVHSAAGQDGRPLLSAAPVGARARFVLPLLQPRDRVRLSRFAVLRPCGGELLVESPLAPYRVRLHRHLAVRVATALSAATTVVDLATALRVTRPVVTDLVAYLVAAGVVLRGDRDPPAGRTGFAEDHDPVLARWTGHDLHFHTATRHGRGDGPSGAVYPLAGRTPPPPALRPPRPGRAVPLPRPDLAARAATDPPLVAVVEAERGAGPPGVRAPSCAELGELLYRTARVRRTTRALVDGVPAHEVGDRPHVDWLGLYELELYLCVDRCDGLARGLYHYDPAGHALTALDADDEGLGELLDGTRVAVGADDRPPVLITVTLRTDRSSWVYRDTGYAMALTHVGALQQLLHLTARAMGLGPLVPPFGPGDVADRVLGLDWRAETAVGECAVGYPAAAAPDGRHGV
ncbi:SagB family peptide dehydrogenase [Actinosynnema sp. NPDC050436]|uniref:SagB family peptide dehydrogenase n=1 Tax=Actinosynnema sp. NPDC050436 TaxID=3155659 RepID=UPI0033F9B800